MVQLPKELIEQKKALLHRYAFMLFKLISNVQLYLLYPPTFPLLWKNYDTNRHLNRECVCVCVSVCERERAGGEGLNE